MQAKSIVYNGISYTLVPNAELVSYPTIILSDGLLHVDLVGLTFNRYKELTEQYPDIIAKIVFLDDEHAPNPNECCYFIMREHNCDLWAPTIHAIGDIHSFYITERCDITVAVSRLLKLALLHD